VQGNAQELSALRPCTEPLLRQIFLAPLLLEYLEEVAIGVAEEEAVERRIAQGIDHLGPVGDQALFERWKTGARKAQRDVPAVLLLERRGLELGNLDQVQLLPRRDLQPGDGRRVVPRPPDRRPAQDLVEEGR